MCSAPLIYLAACICLIVSRVATPARSKVAYAAMAVGIALVAVLYVKG